MNVRAPRFTLMVCLVLLISGASYTALAWSGVNITAASAMSTAITATPSEEGIPFIPIPTQNRAVPIEEYLAEVFTPNIVYSVAFLPNGEYLEVRESPDIPVPNSHTRDPYTRYSEVTDELWNSRLVRLTGASQVVDGETWVSVAYDDPIPFTAYGYAWPFSDVFVLNIEPKYAGWVKRIHLVGNVPRAVFCADPRIMPLMDDLRAALADEDAEALAEIASPRGLYMSFHAGGVLYLTPDEVRGFFEDDSERNWGNNGYRQNDLISSLADGVIPRLKEDLSSEDRIVACNDNQDNLSDNTVLYALRMNGYEDGVHNFYSVMHPGPPGFELDWSAWGLAFEYWDEQPRLLGLGHYRWVP